MVSTIEAGRVLIRITYISLTLSISHIYGIVIFTSSSISFHFHQIDSHTFKITANFLFYSCSKQQSSFSMGYGCSQVINLSGESLHKNISRKIMTTMILHSSKVITMCFVYCNRPLRHFFRVVFCG